ncbi:hypothetical protein E9993_21070 [Labilibacter sediminis]|nr:hypothetical protein E9993_21070 [Labilibacter sediminis]
MKKILLIIFVCCTCFMVDCLAQGSRKTGDDYYKVGTYDRAIKSFKRELKKKPEDLKLHEKIAISYLNSNIDRSLAIPHIEKILEKELSLEWVLNYGIALFYGMHLEEALNEFEWVMNNSSEQDYEYGIAKEYINWIANARLYIKEPLNVEFINLGSHINTNKSELNPFISVSEEMLVYSSNKRYHSNPGINYHNVCVSIRDGQKWNKGKTIGSYINTGYDEMVAGLSPDGSSLFVFHNREGDEQVAYTEYKGNYRFSILQNYGNSINRKGGEYGVWLSQSKDTIIYAAENIKGDTDIFYSLKLPNGEYGESRMLKGNINSDKEENFPVLTNGGKRLYFSSNNSQSMGGYDLFYSDWDEENKEWSVPVNMGYPINDTYDNYTISLTDDLRYGYVSAVRPEGFGERDIYKVIFKKEDPSHLIFKCHVFFDSDTGLVKPAYVINATLKDVESQKVIGEYKSNLDSANFVMALQPGKYILQLFNQNTLLYNDSVKVEEMLYNHFPKPLELVIPMKRPGLDIKKK